MSEMKTALLALLAAAAVGAAAIAQDGVDRSQDAAWHNRQQAALSALQAEDGWQWMEGGLRWRRIAGDGSGRHPIVADTVTVHYAGTFIDGSEFDSSYGGEPVAFPLGRLVPAWQLAIPQMGVGDTIEIAAPATLAYGTKGKGPIPGGATLLFKIELLDVGGR